MNQNLPTVDDAYIESVYEDLKRMEVPLDSDPIMYGPKALNAKVALCRRHLDRCLHIFLQVSDDLHKVKRAFRRAKADFDLQMQDLIVNDPEVRAGRSMRDREATATLKLRSGREKIDLLETASSDLEMALIVVRAKRDDLKDVQGRIRDQIKLCAEEIGLGAKWGSVSRTVTVDIDHHPRVDVKALEEVQEILSQIEKDDDGQDSLAAYVRAETGMDFEEEEVVITDIGGEEEEEEDVPVTQVAAGTSSDASPNASDTSKSVDDTPTLEAPDVSLDIETALDSIVADTLDEPIPDIFKNDNAAAPSSESVMPSTVSADDADAFLAELGISDVAAPVSKAPAVSHPTIDDVDIESFLSGIGVDG